MKREEIENAWRGYLQSNNLPDLVPAPLDFAIQIHDKALEEAAVSIQEHYELDWEDFPDLVRALKIGEK